MDDIVGILKKELEIYKSENEIVKIKVSAIENDNIPLIEEVTKKEEVLVKNIQVLETQRIKIVRELGFATVTQYAESLESQNAREELLAIKAELISVLEDIQFYNKTAEQLVSISSGILNTVVKGVTGNKEIGYMRDKQKKEFTQNNLLNKKI